MLEPLRTKIIEVTHSTMVTGHPGRHQTYTLVARDYFWPGLATDIQRLVRNCDVCSRIKP